MLHRVVTRRWLVAVALVVGLPLGALCQPPYMRAWTLLALECDWVLVSLWLSWRKTPEQPREPLWAPVWLLLGIGDILYNAWAADVPRYPAHYLPDALFVGMAGLLIVLVRRMRGAQHGTFIDDALVALGALAALGVEFYVVLGLPHGESVPPLATSLTWIYAGATAWLSGELLVLTLRTTSWTTLGRGLGLMLMLVGDLAQRHEALVPDGPRQAGEAEVAWVMGLGLACLAHAAAKLSSVRAPISPWASARVAIGLLGPVSSAAVICGAWAWGLLQLFAARDWAQVLGLAWLGWTMSNAVALSICRALGELVPEPGASPEGWLKQLAQPSLPLGELTRWRVEHHRIAERLVSALAAGRKSEDGTQALALAQQLAHDLGGPLMVLERALVGLGAANKPRRHAHADAAGARQQQGALLARRATARLLSLAREARANNARLQQPQLERETPHEDADRAVQCACGGGTVSLHALCTLAHQEAQQRHPQALISLDLQAFDREGGSNVVVPTSAMLRALGNVLDNAAQAVAAHSGTVTLHLERRGGWLDVSVLDDGPGLSQKQAEQFGQGPLPSSRGEGHGLGVWSTSQVMRDAGGTMICAPRAPRGLRVTLSLREQDERPWILIDDDALVVRLWGLRARDVGARLIVVDKDFGSKSVLQRAQRWPKDASVFIDRHLTKRQRGEVLRDALAQQGFVYLHMISGDDGQFGKMPPF